jgi:hypothetical protein
MDILDYACEKINPKIGTRRKSLKGRYTFGITGNRSRN